MLTCPNCPKQFKNEIALKVHLGRTHFLYTEYTCPTCKKQFVFSSRRQKRIYCSPACKYKGLEKRFVGAANPAFKGGALEKQCLYCHKKFKAERSSHKRYSKYCNVSCASRSWWKNPHAHAKLNYKGTNFRTRFEYNYAKWLDEYRLTWFYRPKTFSLSDDATYTPDFFVKEWNIFIDLPSRVNSALQSKIDTFRIKYPNHEIKIMLPDELNQIIKGEIHA